MEAPFLPWSWYEFNLGLIKLLADVRVSMLGWLQGWVGANCGRTRKCPISSELSVGTIKLKSKVLWKVRKH